MRSAYSDKTISSSLNSGAQFDLEDYIYEMQRRSENNPPNNAEGDDIYAQLAQKEKDLILAAELGKALLERNQELTRQNERMGEEFSQQLEALEQAKHSLRRQLATLESESETRAMELAADARELRAQAARREEALKQAEAEKTRLVQELTDQNLRLTAQLKESRRREERVASQLTAAREQFSLRKSSLQDHESHVEILRAELELMTDRRDELEQRLAELMEEREAITSTLEQTSERNLMLERRGREHELQLRQVQRHNHEMISRSTPLTSRVRASPSPGSAGHRSLLSEMETSSDDDLPPNLSPPLTILELQREAISALRALRSLYRELQRGGKNSSGKNSGACSMEVTSGGEEHLSSSSSGCSSSSEDEGEGDEGLGSLKTGRLTRVVSRLCRLIREGPRVISAPELLSLQAELHRARESLSEAGRLLEQRASQIKRASEETMQLQSKLGVSEAQLAATTEERDLARNDLTATGDAALAEARSLRDAALAARNTVQIELARTRIDVLQVNSQLMEAVQQKIELSQQLEQWQVDMQLLLDDQMRQKLTDQEKRRRTGSDPNTPQNENTTPEKPPRRSASRILGFFSR